MMKGLGSLFALVAVCALIAPNAMAKGVRVAKHPSAVTKTMKQRPTKAHKTKVARGSGRTKSRSKVAQPKGLAEVMVIK